MVVAAAAHLTLLPIAPIILLPFILIFFVVVFPIWGVALGVLGLVLLITRGIDKLVGLTGTKSGISAPIYKAFRWVLTFGGFTEKGWHRAKKTKKAA